MSKTKALTEQETIATILVNQRFMRNGSPPIVNALDLLPEKLREEVLDDAQAVIDGLRASRISEETRGKVSQGCELPPPGWFCTRAKGHDGPCAALPEEARG